MYFALLSTDSASTGNTFMIVTLLLMGVLLYFFMIRPNSKREKKAKDLRNSIEVGDEVTTIGGIVGRVVSIKEDTFVLETSGDRSRMRFKRWAIQDVGKLSLESPTEIETPREPEKKGFLAGLFGGGNKKSES